MKRLLILLAALLAGVGSAGAVTFKWAADGDAVSMDPYNVNESFTLGFTGNIYDGLVQRGKDLSIGPGLAESWKTPDPNTWEFTLRRGVKFHDGSDFTSADVVFSWQRAISQGSDLKGYFISVDKVEAKDPYTVVIRTKQPNPILLADISYWWIMSKAWCEKNKAVDVADIRKGTENHASRNANGTGAFILTSRQAGVKTTLKRNPGWWGWKARSTQANSNIDEVIFTPIGQDATRVAALLSGDIDMVYTLPVQDLDRVRGAGLKVYQAPELRTIFLGLDQARPELLESDVKGKNPFKDVRVRKAMYMAIDEDTIVSRVMRGAATPAKGMVVDFVTGYNGNFKRYPYDPEGAKKLLAEAGYPNGFTVGFDCPNDRYVNDAQICQAVAAMWARIGINAKLNAQTKSLYFNKILKRDTSVYLLGWSPATVDGLNVLDNLFYTPDDKAGKGRFNLGSYSNPKVDALTEQARAEFDPKKRAKLLQEALDMAHADVGSIPLHYQQVIWGSKKGIDLVIRADNQFGWYWVTSK
jgi:peptide/nickel transport system substrate-binding protein